VLKSSAIHGTDVFRIPELKTLPLTRITTKNIQKMKIIAGPEYRLNMPRIAGYVR